MRMQVKLTPEEVENIVHDWLSRSFKQVGKVTLEVGGNQMHESRYPAFKGATCEVEQ